MCVGDAFPGPRPPRPAAGAGKPARGRMSAARRHDPPRPDRAAGEGRAGPARSASGLVARAVAGSAVLAALAGLIALAVAAAFGWRPP